MMRWTVEDLEEILAISSDEFTKTMERMECCSCPFEKGCSKYGGRTECAIIARAEIAESTRNATKNKKLEVTLTGAVTERVTLSITEKQAVLLNYLYENGWLRDNVCIFAREDEDIVDLT